MNEGNQARQWPCGVNVVSYNYDHEFYHELGDDRYLDFVDTCDYDPFSAEAKVPGPYRISALNIQSLHCALNENKIDWHSSQIMALSETCATQFVLDKAKKASSAHAQHCFSTLPVKRRTFKRGTISEGRGENAGTWVTSVSHCRPILTPWPDDISKLCRVSDALVYTPSGPIYVACLYGYHQGYPEASAKTDRIMEAIFERSQLLDIPAVVLGDFNTQLETMPVWGCMCERGWKDAAFCHQYRTGEVPGPTFKEISRIDFVIMNNMAQRAFLRYEVSEMPISDHRRVSVDFDWDRCGQKATLYRMPRDWSTLGIPSQYFTDARVPVVNQMAFEAAIRTPGVDRAWEAFTDAMEQVAKNIVLKQGNGPMPKKFLGKNRCKFIQTRVAAPVIKKGRDDAFRAEVEDSGTQLRQHITQIRRFDAFLAQCHSQLPWSEARQHSMSLTWQAILKARGFPKGFAVWFLGEFDSPCPLDSPSEHIARWMREKLAGQLQHWRSLYNNTRARQIRSKFEQDWTHGGRLFHKALRDPQPPPVHAIDRVDHLMVRHLRARKKGISTFMLVNDDLQMVAVGQKWTQNNAVGFVSAIINGNVQLRITQGTFRTGQVQAATTCHDPSQALRIASDFWESFWKQGTRAHLCQQQATRVVEALPVMPQADAKITIYELKNALKTLPLGKARGMDAISNWELKYICDDLQQMLLQILNRIGETGQWPQPLLNARMHLIRKTAEPGDINSTRPICVLPNVYRLWGKVMTAKCFKHIRTRLPNTLCGLVPGRSSVDLATQLQPEIEHHLITGVPLYGASLDLHKAFNTLSRPLLARLCSRLGRQDVWAPYEKFLSKFSRFFTLKQHWSHPITSDNGVPEGCPLSVVMMVLTT